MGYAGHAGAIPEIEWLKGTTVGFQGPWGTSHPSNLRDMSDADLRAIYRYVRSLGAAGELTPPNAPPGGRVRTPVIVFVPQMPVQVAQAGR